MVFFVDHEREALFWAHDDATWACPVSELVADEMTLDQDLPFDRAHVVHAKQQSVGEGTRATGGTRHAHQHTLKLFVARPVSERHTLKIARETDARRQHHVGVRTRPRQPRAGGRNQLIERRSLVRHQLSSVRPVCSSASSR